MACVGSIGDLGVGLTAALLEVQAVPGSSGSNEVRGRMASRKRRRLSDRSELDGKSLSSEQICRGPVAQGLTWPGVQLVDDLGDMLDCVDGEIGALREILACQTIEILIRTALPRAASLGKVDIDAG